MTEYFLKYDNIGLITSKRSLIDKNSQVLHDQKFNELFKNNSIIDRKYALKLIYPYGNFIGEPSVIMLKKNTIRKHSTQSSNDF